MLKASDASIYCMRCDPSSPIQTDNLSGPNQIQQFWREENNLSFSTPIEEKKSSPKPPQAASPSSQGLRKAKQGRYDSSTPSRIRWRREDSPGPLENYQRPTSSFQEPKKIVIQDSPKSHEPCDTVMTENHDTETDQSSELVRWNTELPNLRGGPCSLPTGLQNMGNTCYMNSVLQCLLHLGALSDCLSALSTRFSTEQPMTQALERTFMTLSVSKSKSYAPREFRKTLITRFPMFAGYEQQDAQEMLRMVLDCIDEENKHPCPLREGKKAPSFVSHLFEGQLETQITCTRCHKVSKKKDSFHELPLSLPDLDALNNVREEQGREQVTRRWGTAFTDWMGITSGAEMSLQDCVDAFCSAEMLEGNNQYQCENCKTTTDSKKIVVISQLPSILCVYLKRFRYGRDGGDKLSNAVKFPMRGWNPTPLAADSGLYDLCGMVNHRGTVSGGHYVAYTHRGGKWFECNDSYVCEVSSSSVETTEAYILFYTRRPSPEMTSLLAEACDHRIVSRSEDLVGVDLLWWNQFKNAVSPLPPPDHCDLICPHGQIHPQHTDLTNRLQALSASCWRTIRSSLRYKDSPLHAIENFTRCSTCQKHHEAVKERRKSEKETVEFHDRKNIYMGEQWHIVDFVWLSGLRRFLRGQSDEIPGPITNERIWDINRSQPKPDLKQGIDYMPVCPPVWNYLHSVYGGGPKILSNTKKHLWTVVSLSNEKQILPSDVYHCDRFRSQ